jgi:hypothetical protein
MIAIKYQTADGQYDENDQQITQWDDKKCAWIVLPAYENEQIDWWGADNDFPGGYTLADYIKVHPNWDKMPDIRVTWYWNTKENYIKQFGLPHTFGEGPNYYDNMTFPKSLSRQWGDIDCPKEEAVKRFSNYCHWNEHADRVVVEYNGEVIFDEIREEYGSGPSFPLTS